MDLSARSIVDHGGSTVAILAYREDAGSVNGDRSGLLALFHATKGSSWTRGYHWNTPQPLKDWPGVYTSESGRVKMLRLWGNSVKGPLPSQLGDLTALVELNLSRNSLIGRIPPEIGNLRVLKIISLQNNMLYGLIPPELGELADLETLNLACNKRSCSLPPELGKLRVLVTLEMQNNHLVGPIPPSFGNLDRLEYMNLNGNRIQSAFDERPGLPQVRTCFDLRNVKVEIDGYAVEKWRAYLRGQQHPQQQQQRAAPISTGHAPMEQQQSQPQPLPVAFAVDCVQGTGPIAAVCSSIGGDTSSGVAGDVWRRGGTLPASGIPAPTASGGVARGVSHAVPGYGGVAVSAGGVVRAESGQSGATEESLRRLAAQYPVLRHLTSDNTNNGLVEIGQIVEEQMDVGPGVEVNRISVQEYVLRELNGLAQMAAGFHAVTSRVEPIAHGRRLEDPSSPPMESSSLSAYRATLTRGFCVALLAANVMDNRLVTKRGTADMETAGTVLDVVGLVAADDETGLKRLAERLRSGRRRFVHTGRNLQMTDVAVNFVECRAMAERVARMVYDDSKKGERGVPREGDGTLNLAPKSHGPDDSNTPDAGSPFGWFVDHVASWCESDSVGKSDTSSAKEGHRRAVVDLKKMLLAVEQGHVGKAHGVNAKVDALVQTLHPPTRTAFLGSELQPSVSLAAELKAALDASIAEIHKLKSEVEDLRRVTTDLMPVAGLG